MGEVLRAMNQERSGVLAFLVIAAGSITLALLFREGPPREAVSCAAPEPKVFPGALSTPLPKDASAILRHVNDLGPTPPLTKAEAWLVPANLWLGASGPSSDVFGFYERRMAPVLFEEMPGSLRLLLGLPRRGDVDSPPLLFLGEGSAVLIRIDAEADASLLLMSCSTEE